MLFVSVLAAGPFTAVVIILSKWPNLQAPGAMTEQFVGQPVTAGCARQGKHTSELVCLSLGHSADGNSIAVQAQLPLLPFPAHSETRQESFTVLQERENEVRQNVNQSTV